MRVMVAHGATSPCLKAPQDSGVKAGQRTKYHLIAAEAINAYIDLKKRCSRKTH
jgi:hypothetical protein